MCTSVGICASHDTIQELARIEVKKSVFISYMAPTRTKEEAKAYISRIRALHKDARHVCSVFILSSGISQLSDDGEPSGSAAKPMATVLEHKHMSDVCVCAVRYFGGTLLGVGGLIRAYADVTQMGIENAHERGIIIEQTLVQNISCEISYAMYESVCHLLKQYHCQIQDTQFSDVVRIICVCEVAQDTEKVPRLVNTLQELCCGRIQLSTTEPYIGEKLA